MDKKVQTSDAERMIEEYLTERHGHSFASEIADALGLDFGVTVKAIHRLLEDGHIKQAKK